MNCYPCNVNVNKCRGYFNTSNSFKSCNTIDDPYSRICIPNKVKNMNVKVFNSTSQVNETRFLVQHESCSY